MIDELRKVINNPAKVNDMVSRLNNKRVDQALPAEIEIAFLWGIKQVADLIIEPETKSGKRPEAFSKSLFEKPAFIEVTTLSDGSLSGEKRIRSAIQKITNSANQIKKGVGNYLYFSFHEASGWIDGNFYRDFGVEEDFKVDDALNAKLTNWLNSNPCGKNQKVRLTHPTIDVTIEKKTHKTRTGRNYSYSSPSLPHKINDNPLYSCLYRKDKDQLKNLPIDHYKVILLADTGSELLRRMNPPGSTHPFKSASDIINYFLESSNTDIVCVFSTQNGNSSSNSNGVRLGWAVTFFCKENLSPNVENLAKMIDLLPSPRFEGYNAKSLHEQNSFNPTNNKWYLGPNIREKGDKIEMTISSRALLEYLAGRTDNERFSRNAFFKDDNYFEFWLQQGYCIEDITIKSGGLDEDDDLVCFTFKLDASISPIK
ncbi:hypothetical protein [Emcibacter sp.]|uniref:hypothetical protein n=1 Tax=Emcibacter sp. TaxID=1979954 RepID=UPI003A8D928E